MRRSALILGIVLAAPARAADCEAPTTARDLADATRSFYAAWDQMDADAAGSAVDEADRAIACLDEPLAPPDAVAYFQVVGLRAFLAEDTTRARDAFRAALGILPNYSLPSTVAAPGDDWYEMYEALRSVPDDARAPLTSPAEGWVSVDGARADEHPSGRPWVFQQFDPTGAVVQSAVVWTREKPPEYAAVEAAPEVVQTPAVPAPKEGTGVNKGLLVGGLSVAAAGGAALAGAGILRMRYNAEDVPLPEANGLVAPNLILGSLGIAAMTAGAGMATGAVVVARW